MILKNNNEYARIILSSPVTRQDNWTAYYAIFLSRNTFILPAFYFSIKQLDCLHEGNPHHLLAKGGYMSMISRAVAYGPHLYMVGYHSARFGLNN